MVPAPGESPGQWWDNTGYEQSVAEQAGRDGGQTGHDDPLITYYNGVPRPLAEEALRRGGRGESSAVSIADEVPGCHCAALSHPKELSDLLVSYLG